MPYIKYYAYKEMITYDGGETWEETGNVAPSGTPIAYFETLEECETVVPQYRWVDSGTTCYDYGLYNRQIKQVSYDNGRTWTNVIPEEYQIGSLIEDCSDECLPEMPVVDMTGKLLVSLNGDGSIARDHNCCVIPPDDPLGGGYNWIAPEPDTTIKCGAYTNKRSYGLFGEFVYIGSCAKFREYAFDKDTWFGKGVHCCTAVYFEGPNVNLSRGLFDGVCIRKVVVGDSATTFTMASPYEGNTPSANFKGGSGDISEILLRTLDVSTDAFRSSSVDVLSNPPFGDTAEFNQLVELHKNAFLWSGFSNIIFNNGLKFSDLDVTTSNFNDIFNIGYGTKPTITLNGPAENYSVSPPFSSSGDIASILSGIGCTVIDNRVYRPGFTANYSNQQQFTDDCRESSYYTVEGILTSGITKPNGYDYTLMTSAIVGSCYKWIGYSSFSGNTFQGCTSLTSVTFEGDIEGFGNRAFADCVSITSIGPKGSGCMVEIPNSVTRLPSDVFSGCTGLTYIEIPSGITEIDSGAFYCSWGDGNLHTLKLNSSTPPTLESASFLPSLANDFQILVPCGSLNTYKNRSYWRNYSRYMVEYGC